MSGVDETHHRSYLRTTLIVGVTLCVITAGAYVGLIALGRMPNPLGPPDPLGAISACEESLKKGLVAPSTYRRVSAKAYILPPLTKQEHRAFALSAGCAEAPNPRNCQDIHQLGSAYMATDPELRKKIGLTGPLPKTRMKAVEVSSDATYTMYLKWPADNQRTAAAEIVYDAVNSYNAPIRTTKVCRFGPIGNRHRYSSDSTFDPDADYIHTGF